MNYKGNNLLRVPGIKFVSSADFTCFWVWKNVNHNVRNNFVWLLQQSWLTNYLWLAKERYQLLIPNSPLCQTRWPWIIPNDWLSFLFLPPNTNGIAEASNITSPVGLLSEPNTTSPLPKQHNLFLKSTVPASILQNSLSALNLIYYYVNITFFSPVLCFSLLLD